MTTFEPTAGDRGPVGDDAPLATRLPTLDVATDPQTLARVINARFNARVVQQGAAARPRDTGISTGFSALDAATGWQGFPRGHVTELIGVPTSGCASVALSAVAAAEGYSAWIDVRGVLDVDHAARHGVDLERLFILRPARPLDGIAFAAQLTEGGHFTLVVLDTLADLAPGGPTSQSVAQFLRILTPRLGRTATAALILTAPHQHFRSLAHAAALRIAFQQTGLLRRGGVLRGWRTRASIVKGRGSPGTDVGLELWLH